MASHVNQYDALWTYTWNVSSTVATDVHPRYREQICKIYSGTDSLTFTLNPDTTAPVLFTSVSSLTTLGYSDKTLFYGCINQLVSSTLMQLH